MLSTELTRFQEILAVKNVIMLHDYFLIK